MDLGVLGSIPRGGTILPPAFAGFSVAAIVVAATSLAVPAAELVVDLGALVKPVDHAASGSLYGIAADGWPADLWIAATKPRNFTQMAPGGGQLPNGERAPVGDALDVAPIAARAGASVTIRMPDVFPSFPYVWQGEAAWTASVDAMVRATVKADPPNIYAYEIWNEPDWDWRPEWGDFDAMWAKTFTAIRAIDPARRIMGPSAAHWDESWMRRFLSAAIAHHAVPEMVSWHELDPATERDLGAHVAAYRALERELGIGPLPISINEYGAPRDAAVPGALAGLVGKLERAGVDTADLAFWHRPGRLADLLAPIAGGPGPARDAEPTGAFWVYKWYGDMTGSMLAVTPATPTQPLDGFASLDAAGRTARIVFGGEAGDHKLIVRGLGGFGASVAVQIYATHWTGTDGALLAPDALAAKTLPVTDGTAELAIDNAKAGDAYLVLVSRPGDAAPFDATPHPFSLRLEAEDMTFTGARRFAISMAAGNFFANTVSGNAYVGLLDREQASIAFTATVPKAGQYLLSFGYSSGLAAAATYHVAVGNEAPVPIVFTPTQGRELIDKSSLTVTLPAGSVTITLGNGPNSPKGSLLPSLVEIDYLDLTAL